MQGTDLQSPPNTGSGTGYFSIVETLPDFWIHSTDISFLFDEPLDIGDTATIEATVHADIENTVPGINIPVTFYAKHPAGDYKIGQTQYIPHILPGDSNSVSVTWQNAPATRSTWMQLGINLFNDIKR